MILAQLRSRARVDGASPLLTAHDANGARTELSAISTANWADKVANWLLEEGDLAPGDAVRLGVLATHPTSWMAMVAVLGCWRAGAVVVLDDAAEAALDVVAADSPVTRPGATLVCSLHPLALPTPDLPVGALDFGREVLAMPDVFLGPDAGEPDLSALPAVEPRAGVGLVRAGDPWRTLAEGLVAPLAGGGSSVLVDPALDEARIARIAIQERVAS